MGKSTLNLRHPHVFAPTKAIVSGQAKVPVVPHAGTTSLNASQLSAGSVPTKVIRSNLSKLPH